MTLGDATFGHVTLNSDDNWRARYVGDLVLTFIEISVTTLGYFRQILVVNCYTKVAQISGDFLGYLKIIII